MTLVPPIAERGTEAVDGPAARLSPARSASMTRSRDDTMVQGKRLAGNIGNQATLRLLSKRPGPSEYSATVAGHALPGIVQPKLVVGELDHPLEHEADRIADQVMNAPAVRASFSAGFRDRQLNARSDPESLLAKSVSAVSSGDSGGIAAPPIVHEALQSAGMPLDAGSRAFFEPRFGHDFSNVRIHSDELAAASVRSVGALAYASGAHIAFAEGQYAPQTQAGKRLLAHELTHTLQQRGPAPSHLFRETPPGGGAAAAAIRRVVYIDANVINQIADGNVEAAHALLAMFGGNADLRIARATVTEIARSNVAELVAARKLIIQEFGIKIDEGAGLASRMLSYETYAEKGVMVQLKDLPMIAAAKASGERNVEIWSLDGGVKSNAKQFGVEPARECNVAVTHPNPDVHAGLDNVGLHDWTITEDGKAIRAPRPGGGKPPSGGGTPSGDPAPATPGNEASLPGDADAAVHPSGEANQGGGAAGWNEGASAEGDAIGAVSEVGIGSKIGSLIEGFLPNPLDVPLVLGTGYFGAIAEAKEQMEAEAYSLGFSEGLAARLLKLDPGWAMQHLEERRARPGVWGAAASKANNQGVQQGYRFATSFAQDRGQVDTLLEKGLKAMGHGDRGTFSLSSPTRDDVIHLGIALRPFADSAIAMQAQEAKDAWEHEQAVKLDKRGWTGTKF